MNSTGNGANLSPESGSEINIALLRGINVGGKNKLLMKDLAAMFSDAGCQDVRTYIQSGNVLFRAEPALEQDIPSRVSASILSRFGYRIPIVTRTARELQVIVQDNPFLKHGDEPDKLHVAFLPEIPAPAKVEALDANRSTPDEFAVLGREIYLYCPNGLARTKLTNSYFESTLSTISTMRSWKTVTRLLDMAASVK